MKLIDSKIYNEIIDKFKDTTAFYHLILIKTKENELLITSIFKLLEYLLTEEYSKYFNDIKFYERPICDTNMNAAILEVYVDESLYAIISLDKVLNSKDSTKDDFMYTFYKLYIK